MTSIWRLERWYKTPSQKETIKLYSNRFIKVRRMFFERCANEAVERMEVKGGIRLNTREAFYMSYQELRSIRCKNERPGRKVICVGCYRPKSLSLASHVNLGTRFLLRGIVLSHPEIFEFQDVIKIKNKTTIFSPF